MVILIILASLALAGGALWFNWYEYKKGRIDDSNQLHQLYKKRDQINAQLKELEQTKEEIRKLEEKTFFENGVRYWISDENDAHIIECSVIDDISVLEIPEYVTFKEEKYEVTCIEGEVFMGNEKLTSISISNSIKLIGGGAFQGCKNLTSATIGSGVTDILSRAFEGCEKLTSIEIPNSVTRIGDLAFAFCNKLTSITIPNNVACIEKFAFAECKSLTSATIGSGVTDIGKGIFINCMRLREVVCLAENPPFVEDNSFAHHKIPILKVSINALDAYKNSEWNGFFNEIVAM